MFLSRYKPNSFYLFTAFALPRLPRSHVQQQAALLKIATSFAPNVDIEQKANS